MKKLKKNPFVRGVLSVALIALGVVLYPGSGVGMSDLVWRSLASGWSILFGAILLAENLLLIFKRRL